MSRRYVYFTASTQDRFLGRGLDGTYSPKSGLAGLKMKSQFHMTKSQVKAKQMLRELQKREEEVIDYLTAWLKED